MKRSKPITRALDEICGEFNALKVNLMWRKYTVLTIRDVYSELLYCHSWEKTHAIVANTIYVTYIWQRKL